MLLKIHTKEHRKNIDIINTIWWKKKKKKKKKSDPREEKAQETKPHFSKMGVKKKKNQKLRVPTEMGKRERERETKK